MEDRAFHIIARVVSPSSVALSFFRMPGFLYDNRHPLKLRLLLLFNLNDSDFVTPLELSGDPLLGRPHRSLGVPIMKHCCFIYSW